MLPVTQGYLDNMVSIERQTFGRIEFAQIDVTANTDANVTATSTESITSTSNIVNGNYIATKNYASFETDRFALDGSFSLLPSSAQYGEIGWWSSTLSGADKTFSPNQVLTFQFTQNHSSIGFTIIFDEINNEYATDFTLVLYDSGNAILQAFTVTGNTLSRYIADTPVANYRKAVLTIQKWSKADRRARILEMVFGELLVYEGSNIINMNAIEEIDPTSVNCPQNQLNFSIDNSDRKYDILNPSGVYSYMQKQQPIKAYLGTKVSGVIEYAPLGVYYLSSWKTDRLTASFNANDAFDLLQNVYRKGLYQTRSLYNLCIDVLTDAGFTSDKYSVDTALQNINVQSYIPIITYKQALQMIALAGQSIIYCDRNGKIIIKQLTSAPTGFTIDLANSYDVPKIDLDNVVKDISVNSYSFTSDVTTSTIFSGSISISGTQSIWIEYKDPAVNASAVVSGGTLNSATYYTGAALLNITANGTVTITVSGNKLNAFSYPITIINDVAGVSLKVDNKLITTQASSIGSWIQTEKNKRRKLTSSWRQNPALEASDIVDIETNFETYSNTRITKQVFEFNGVLKGKTEVRG